MISFPFHKGNKNVGGYWLYVEAISTHQSREMDWVSVHQKHPKIKKIRRAAPLLEDALTTPLNPSLTRP
jgi:hypothetical protein